MSLKDVCSGHMAADDVLCEFLRDLGYEDVEKEYRYVIKWFE